jgi:hypothetical protein
VLEASGAVLEKQRLPAVAELHDGSPSTLQVLGVAVVRDQDVAGLEQATAREARENEGNTVGVQVAVGGDRRKNLWVAKVLED